MDLLETLLVLVAVVAGVVEGSPNGVPKKQPLCVSMAPAHNVPPQTTPAPFVIKLNATEVMCGEALEIRVTAADGEAPLAALFLMVRKKGDDTTGQGHFTSVTPADQMELLNHCFDIPGGAIGHLTPAEKPEVVAEWVAPKKPNADGEFVVVATIVRTYLVFWTKHYFPQVIKIKSNPSMPTDKPETSTDVTENKSGSGASQIKTAALFPRVSQQTHFGARILQQLWSLAAASVIASMCLVK